MQVPAPVPVLVQVPLQVPVSVPAPVVGLVTAAGRLQSGVAAINRHWPDRQHRHPLIAPAAAGSAHSQSNAGRFSDTEI